MKNQFYKNYKTIKTDCERCKNDVIENNVNCETGLTGDEQVSVSILDRIIHH